MSERTRRSGSAAPRAESAPAEPASAAPRRVAVRPPEYLPRLPVAALLLAADRFVIADTFRFSRQSAHNRARIQTAAGARWLSVPRQHTSSRHSAATPGSAVALRDLAVVDDGWRRRHVHAVRAAYGLAPFYDHYAPDLAALLAEPPASLAALTVAAMRWAARRLGAECEIVVASELPGAPATLPAVWRAAGGTLLTLPESAAGDAAALTARVEVLRFGEAPRRQVFEPFAPGCCVLDLLMSYGPRAADVLRTQSDMSILVRPQSTTS